MSKIGTRLTAGPFTLTLADIADGAVTLAKFSAGLRPIEIVDSLPDPGTPGRVVFLTTDNQLYRDTGTAWTVVVSAANITGQLTDEQLAAIAAAKITGTITETQIADNSISTPKLKAGSVTTNEIAANTITAADIAALTITGAEIAANTITAAKIAVGTITSNELAANSVIAGKIAAGAIDAMVITGSTVRTAASGQRIQLNSTDGLVSYDADGNILYQIPTTAAVIPSVMLNLDMSKSGKGQFIATWADPATGASSLITFAEEYSLSKSTWSAVDGTLLFPWARAAQGTRPNTSYYFRFAARNLSGAASSADGPGPSLGQTGWGPWIYSGNTTTMANATLISSGDIPPIDTVVPGPIQNLEMNVGPGGVFKASWTDPATGYNTIDDICQDISPSNWTNFIQKYWGRTNCCEFISLNATYYFRYAAHNKSGLAGDPSGPGGTGWGPWVYHNGAGGTTNQAGAVSLSSGYQPIQNGAINAIAQFVNALKPVEIVDSLPAAGTQGRILFLTTDNKLYRDTGAAWTAVVPSTDITGTITETQIANESISTPKLQAGSVTTSRVAAGAITANELAANSVIAGTIAAGAIDGMVITGATIRTGVSGERVVMSGSALAAYNQYDVNTFGLQGDYCFIRWLSSSDITADTMNALMFLQSGDAVVYNKCFIGSGGVDVGSALVKGGSLTLGSTGLSESQLIAIKAHCGV